MSLILIKQAGRLKAGRDDIPESDIKRAPIWTARHG